MTTTPRHMQRTVLSLLAAGGLVVGGVLSAAPSGSGSGALSSTYDAQTRDRAEAVAERRPHTHPGQAAAVGSFGDGHGHVHNDPTTKNAISRSGEAAQAPDRTTPAQRPPAGRGSPRSAPSASLDWSASRCAASGAWCRGRVRDGGRLLPPRGQSPRSRRRASAATSSTPPTARSSPPPGRRCLGGRPVAGVGLDRPPDRCRSLHLHAGRRSRAPAYVGRLRDRGGRVVRIPSHRRLHGVPRGRDQRQRSALRRRDAVPGGPWLRRPPRPRPDPRVPRRPGDLQPAVPQVRRRCRPRRLPRPPARRRPRRRARGRPRRQDPRQRARPGGPADVLLLAEPALADPPAGLLQVARALVACRAARPHQPADREPHPLHGLSLKKNSCDDRDAVRLQAADMRAMQDYIDAQYGGPGRGWYRISPTRSRPAG